jgi:hypothetical protein
MLITNLPKEARVWVYQCDRELHPEELAKLVAMLSSFVASWQVHGKPLPAGFSIKYNRFVILMADETVEAVSGCSIDSSVAAMKTASTTLGVDFFNRQLITWKENSEIKSAPMHQFWAMRKAGILTNDTVVFNNLVKTIADFETSWEVPFSRSWHAEMFR